MKLYKVNLSDYESFFGHSLNENLRERDATFIAQTPSCDAFLFLSNATYEDNVELQDSVPSGFNFTYNQSWGSAVNQTIIDRVIADLG
tara:strand:- start:15 stop:278 length:264 start_codon:yes stop_codon:yes gene_type:complete